MASSSSTQGRVVRTAVDRAVCIRPGGPAGAGRAADPRCAGRGGTAPDRAAVWCDRRRHRRRQWAQRSELDRGGAAAGDPDSGRQHPFDVRALCGTAGRYIGDHSPALRRDRRGAGTAQPCDQPEPDLCRTASARPDDRQRCPRDRGSGLCRTGGRHRGTHRCAQRRVGVGGGAGQRDCQSEPDPGGPAAADPDR